MLLNSVRAIIQFLLNPIYVSSHVGTVIMMLATSIFYSVTMIPLACLKAYINADLYEAIKTAAKQGFFAIGLPMLSIILIAIFPCLVTYSISLILCVMVFCVVRT